MQPRINLPENASPEQLVARARDMIPMLRTGAAGVEKARQVPASIIQAFQEAGFFQILRPQRWGGWEMDLRVFYRVLMELGRGCSSSAWVMMVLGIHTWEFGLLALQAGDDVWGKNRSAIVASSYAPIALCNRVDGGWKISGRWPTSSGTDHAQWLFLGGRIEKPTASTPKHLTLLVPRSDCRITDDRFVFGLTGTGNKTIEILDAFVPEYRTHDGHEVRFPGRIRHYRIPFRIAFYGAVSAVINGMASGAIDIYSEQMSVRKTTGVGLPVSASPYVKDRLANAVSLVRSSRASLLQLMEDATEWTGLERDLPVNFVVRAMRDITRVGQECEQAVLLLFKAMAARGIQLDNPMQRVLRNVLAGANHITQNADDTSGVLGGYLLGQPLPEGVFTRQST
jgi:3-hydroxy-9,10-secoandrosta-1,3,5(10)-triene-9,17-dione monooxygenase